MEQNLIDFNSQEYLQSLAFYAANMNVQPVEQITQTLTSMYQNMINNNYSKDTAFKHIQNIVEKLTNLKSCDSQKQTDLNAFLQKVQSLEVVKTQQNDKQFNCDLCCIQFQTETEYIAHAKLHLDQTKVRCEICGNQSESLQLHLKHIQAHSEKK